VSLGAVTSRPILDVLGGTERPGVWRLGITGSAHGRVPSRFVEHKKLRAAAVRKIQLPLFSDSEKRRVSIVYEYRADLLYLRCRLAPRSIQISRIILTRAHLRDYLYGISSLPSYTAAAS